MLEEKWGKRVTVYVNNLRNHNYMLSISIFKQEHYQNRSIITHHIRYKKKNHNNDKCIAIHFYINTIIFKLTVVSITNLNDR